MIAKKTAQPLRTIDEVEKIRRQINNDIRNLLIFDFVTQTGLPARHWLGLKVKDIANLQPGDRLPIRGKIKAVDYNLMVTDTLHGTIAELIRKRNPKVKEYIFQSRKKSVPLAISSVSRLVKSWLKKAGYSRLDGLLTLRKTYELHFRPEHMKAEPSEEKPDTTPVRAMKYPTRQEIICRELERQIVMGILKPAQKLILDKIAKQMGVSTIPVREALSNLEARGFITKKPNGSSVVRELSQKNLIEISNLRIMLECMAARNAAVTRPDSVVDALMDIHEKHAQFRDLGDSDALLLENKNFHFTIYRAAHMPMLLDIITLLWDRTSPYHYIFHRQTEIKKPPKRQFSSR